MGGRNKIQNTDSRNIQELSRTSVRREKKLEEKFEQAGLDVKNVTETKKKGKE